MKWLIWPLLGPLFVSLEDHVLFPDPRELSLKTRLASWWSLHCRHPTQPLCMGPSLPSGPCCPGPWMPVKLSFTNSSFHQYLVQIKSKSSLVQSYLFKLFLFSQTLAGNLQSEPRGKVTIGTDFSLRFWPKIVFYFYFVSHFGYHPGQRLSPCTYLVMVRGL